MLQKFYLNGIEEKILVNIDEVFKVKNFLRNKSPGKDYFIKVNKKFDISKVVRPRENRLLKKIHVFNKPDFIWRTFSSDQIDLNFKNPYVLIQFIKIMLHLTTAICPLRTLVKLFFIMWVDFFLFNFIGN